MILLLILILFFLFLPILFFPKCKHPEGYVDCLIVLGCPTYDNGKMSSTQKLRVEKAAKCVKQYQIPVCIFTGGAVRNEYTEAQVMGDYFKELTNIDPTLEDKSTTTYENMKNCVELCKKFNYQKVGVLTSSFHSSRAYAMSKKFFDDVVMFNAPYRFTLKKLIREYLSRYLYIYIEIKNALNK